MIRRDTVERIIVADASQGKPYRRLNGLLLHQQIGEPFAFLVSNRSYSRLVKTGTEVAPMRIRGWC